MKILNFKFSEKNILVLKDFIYSFLNNYENYENFFVKDIPFCFLSDAYDHVLYNPKKKTKRIEICKKCRLKNFCKGIETGSLFDKYYFLLKPVLETPREVVIEVSNKCNLMCKMCFKNNNVTRELTLNNLKNVIDDIKLNRIKNIRFTGGEPLLNRDIFRILDYSKNNFYVILNTSFAVSCKLVKNLVGKVDNLLVSLQGFDDLSEKYFTGLNYIKIKLKNLNYAIEYFPVVRVGTVITKTLIENFERYLKIIPSGVKLWELYRPMIKNYSIVLKDYFLSLNDYNTLLFKISNQNILNIKIANPIPYCLFKEEFHKYLLGSMYDDGNSRMVYDINGYYKPSYYIDVNLGKTVSKAWNNERLINITYSRKFENKCKKCIYFLKCMGGSYYLGFTKNNKFKDVLFFC